MFRNNIISLYWISAGYFSFSNRVISIILLLRVTVKSWLLSWFYYLPSVFRFSEMTVTFSQTHLPHCHSAIRRDESAALRIWLLAIPGYITITMVSTVYTVFAVSRSARIHKIIINLIDTREEKVVRPYILLVLYLRQRLLFFRVHHLSRCRLERNAVSDIKRI